MESNQSICSEGSTAELFDTEMLDSVPGENDLEMIEAEVSDAAMSDTDMLDPLPSETDVDRLEVEASEEVVINKLAESVQYPPPVSAGAHSDDPPVQSTPSPPESVQYPPPVSAGAHSDDPPVTSTPSPRNTCQGPSSQNAAVLPRRPNMAVQWTCTCGTDQSYNRTAGGAITPAEHSLTCSICEHQIDIHTTF